ncbi:MAG: DUF1501 domain-containing protein [Planctomycetota bacterium]
MSSRPSSLSRRDLLRAGAALGVAPAWLRGLERRAQDRERVVVCVELNGGNDGLNTVAPVGDDLYHRARPDLAVTARDGHPLDDHHRWHPSLARTARRFADGGVAVVQGVGYPRPNLSHFSSLDVWHSGTRTSPAPATGWLGRLADATVAPDVETRPAYDPLTLLAIGHDVAPHALRAERGMPVAVPSLDRSVIPTAPEGAGGMEAASRRAVLEALERTSASRGTGRDARIAAAARAARQAALDLAVARDFEPRAEWPDSSLARHLGLVARVLSKGLPTRFFLVSQRGYDTHAIQGAPHAQLLGDLDAALHAFLTELEARELLDRVLVVTISDFGRRVAQNGQGAGAGTDHGAASIQMLFGAGIEPGLHGPPADLERLDENGNLRHLVDFREVYAGVIGGWLGADPKAVLGDSFRPHPALRS